LPRTQILTLSLGALFAASVLASGTSRRSPYPARRAAGSGSSRAAAPPERPRVGDEARRFLAQATEQITHQQELLGGYLFLRDPEARRVLALRHQEPHAHVARLPSAAARAILRRAPGGTPGLLPSAELRFACHDFKDARTGQIVDVDVWMAREGSAWRPVQYLIHKVGGAERFRYEPHEMQAIE